MPDYKNLNEANLLQAIRGNDEKAFVELVNRFWHPAHRMAYSKIRSKELTQEIVQDFFLNLWDKRSTLVIQNFSSYLFSSIRNRVINHLKSRMSEQKCWAYYKTFIPKAEAPKQTLEYDELTHAINSGIAQLPEKSKEVFQLSRIEGLSVAEIAKVLNLSEKAIEYHITKSLKQLRVHLKDFVTIVVISLLSNLFN